MFNRTKTVKRDSLFYDRYHYCLRLRITYSGAVRDLSYTDLTADINRVRDRIDWRLSRFTNDYEKTQRHNYEQSKIYLTSLVQTLYGIQDFKLVVGYGTLYVYTQNLSDLEKILGDMPDYGRFAWPALTRVEVTHAPGTVVIQSSPHKFRSYFRQTSLSFNEQEHLRNWLKNQTPVIRLSPGLNRWCDTLTDEPYTLGNYFFDYDDPRLLSMLSLVRPGLIKCTKSIVNS